MAAQPIQTDVEAADFAVKLPAQGELKRSGALRQRTASGRSVADAHSAKILAEQNPELLHWRANVLLDEMMLGAIDLAASDSVPARALSPRQAGSGYSTTDRGSGPRRDAGHTIVDKAADFDEPAAYRTGQSRQPSGPSADAQGSTKLDPQGSARPWQSSSTDYPSATQARQPSTTDTVGSPKGVPRAGASSTKEGERPKPANGTEQWLFAAEQRYEQLAARRQASQGAAPTAVGYEYDGWSVASEPTAPQDYGVSAVPYNNRENIHNPVPSYTPPNGSVAAISSSSTLLNGGGVSTGIASTSGRKSLRSNLLPRMNALDSRTVQQEMAMLQNAIESALPVGHESRTRAQHLLQKAHVLVQTDPGRSAEVDYYLQQVRTIMQRAQESVHWSTLYQNRLRTYLLAWLALSIIVILSRYLYAFSLTQWLARLSGQSGSTLLSYNILTIATAFFFGALGGGVGALFTMIQHSRLGQGFFDRKYGLRGLILPLIGALFGLGLCLLFGIFYTIVGVDPASSFWFGLLPALLALAAGASQEYLYGTRES